MEKGVVTCSSILAWRIPWTEEPGGLHSTGCKESDMTEQVTLSHTSTSKKKKGPQRQEVSRIFYLSCKGHSTPASFHRARTCTESLLNCCLNFSPEEVILLLHLGHTGP